MSRRKGSTRKGRRGRRFAAAAGIASVGFGTATTCSLDAEAATPKIYACYSDSNNALYRLNYPTVTKCPTGQTLVQWNSTGPQGPLGSQGLGGALGPVGRRGAQGNQGHLGVVGSIGHSGAVGPQGSVGTQGPQGIRGAQGPQGAAGPQGFKGAQGPQGVQGPVGPQGAPSNRVGPQGPPGQGFGVTTFAHSYAASAGTVIGATPTRVATLFTAPTPNSSGSLLRDSYLIEDATVTLTNHSNKPIDASCWLATSGVRTSVFVDALSPSQGYSKHTPFRTSAQHATTTVMGTAGLAVNGVRYTSASEQFGEGPSHSSFSTRASLALVCEANVASQIRIKNYSVIAKFLSSTNVPLTSAAPGRLHNKFKAARPSTIVK